MQINSYRVIVYIFLYFQVKLNIEIEIYEHIILELRSGNIHIAETGKRRK